ncbi:MAG: sensor histidine kinase [Deltaproteobacteria bacterium]
MNASGDDQTPAQPPRLLVVDDEPPILRALERSLEPEGFAVTCALSPAEGRERLAQGEFEVVISDFRMQGIDGIRFLEEVRDARPRARRVLLTGQADFQTLCDAINRASLHRLFLKPWNHDDLIAALREECRQARFGEQAEELSRLAERRRHELELAHRLLRMQRLALVGQLAAGIAHEINNPLGTILAFSQILLREAKVSRDDLEAISLIEQSAQRCKRVIEAVGRFARGGDGVRATVVLADLANEVQPLLLAEARRVGAEVQVEIEDSQVTVQGSGSELRQAVAALARNGLEALLGRPGQVTLRVFSRRAQPCLSVVDSGHGIDPETRDRIFEPFFTTKPGGEAAGLGLTLVDQIVQAHGGHVEVSSEPGVGSTFTLVFP